MIDKKRNRPVAEAPTGPINPDELYTRAEAAGHCGNSYATMERWAQIGIGPAVTRLYKNASPRYRGRDLLAAMDAGRETQPDHAA